jgi:hypothetical protein
MLDATHAGAALLADEVDLPQSMTAAPAPRAVRLAPANHQALSELVRERVLSGDAEFAAYGPGFNLSGALPADQPPVNYIFAAENDAHEPDDVFRALRWGGQFVYASRSAEKVAALPEKFIRRGFEVATPPSYVRKSFLGIVIPPFSRPVHYFVARKVNLTLPKEISERFTYHVYLSYDRSRRQHVVVKEIPSVERVSARLRAKFPDAPADLIHKRARKFTDKVFPIFLTREAAMLKLLARDLPEPFRNRVPHIIDMEQDAKGFVHRMRMSWLRNAPPAGRPINQLEFARQSAELLQAMHDQARIIHLDLRLDNMVVTEHGVGFVDFGSAVRMGENITGNPLLSTIYDELMRTSQIQRMLEKMTVEGMVTSTIFHEAYGKVDKGVDLFYLALQINKPLTNPDFRGLVKFDRNSEQAERLGVLTEEVLKPQDPAAPTIRSAADLLAGIDRIAGQLHTTAV